MRRTGSVCPTVRQVMYCIPGVAKVMVLVKAPRWPTVVVVITWAPARISTALPGAPMPMTVTGSPTAGCEL
jgi:hypothetical protein